MRSEVLQILLIAAAAVCLGCAENPATWRDPNTGLMWTKKDNGVDITQPQAFNYCRNLSVAGFRDWRVPAIDELQQIMDVSVVSKYSYHGKSFDLHIKGGIQMTGCCAWSVNMAQNYPGEAWTYNFDAGGTTAVEPGFSNLCRALCVRRAE